MVVIEIDEFTYMLYEISGIISFLLFTFAGKFII